MDSTERGGRWTGLWAQFVSVLPLGFMSKEQAEVIGGPAERARASKSCEIWCSEWLEPLKEWNGLSGTVFRSSWQAQFLLSSCSLGGTQVCHQGVPWRQDELEPGSMAFDAHSDRCEQR